MLHVEEGMALVGRGEGGEELKKGQASLREAVAGEETIGTKEIAITT